MTRPITRWRRITVVATFAAATVGLALPAAAASTATLPVLEDGGVATPTGVAWK